MTEIGQGERQYLREREGFKCLALENIHIGKRLAMSHDLLCVIIMYVCERHIRTYIKYIRVKRDLYVYTY